MINIILFILDVGDFISLSDLAKERAKRLDARRPSKTDRWKSTEMAFILSCAVSQSQLAVQFSWGRSVLCSDVEKYFGSIA